MLRMQTAADPVELLAELCHVLECGEDRQGGEAARLWFLNGVRRAMSERCGLDRALGLSGAGLRRLQARAWQVRRDALVAQAAEAVALDQDLTEWARCQRLAEEVAHLHRAGGRVRGLADPPAEWPACRQYLFRASKLCGSLPQTAEGLRLALKRNRAYSLRTASMMMLADYP